MNKLALSLIAFILTFGATAQDESRPRNEIQTIFKSPHSFGGYGALTNKFTTINGSYANLTGGYGGVFVNHKVFIGFGAAATTNYIPVPEEFSIDPTSRMSYEYGQVGMVTEYVLWSNKAIHLNFNLFSGAGFTLQYDRPVNWYYYDDYNYQPRPYGGNDENWFFVVEPGVQVEMNVFKWMRFSPGISFRKAYGSYATGLTDSDLSNATYSVTLKFGKF
jgi:hypothetical protein